MIAGTKKFSLKFQNKLWNEFVVPMIQNQGSFYIKKRNANSFNVQKQIFYSKLAEYAVSYILSKNEYELVEPDIKIYSKKNKNWNADLSYNNGHKIHVKSTTTLIGAKYGLSWTFQFSDKTKYGQDNLFTKADDNDLIAFCEVLDDEPTKSNQVILHGIYSFKLLQKYNLFREPVLKHLKAYKVCIYYDDLINLKEKLKNV